MTAVRSFDATCATHRWPLLSNGTCSLCDRDAAQGRVIPPCPAHTDWPREVKARAFDRYLLAMAQHGTDDERRQQAWQKILDVVARELGIVHDYVTPPAITLQRLTDYFNRPAKTGQDA